MDMQIQHTIQGGKELGQGLVMSREIWESFPEEAASEQRSEGSEETYHGDKFAGSWWGVWRWRGGGHLAESTLAEEGTRVVH